MEKQAREFMEFMEKRIQDKRNEKMRQGFGQTRDIIKTEIAEAEVILCWFKDFYGIKS